jgi:hypothetical protein
MPRQACGQRELRANGFPGVAARPSLPQATWTVRPRVDSSDSCDAGGFGLGTVILVYFLRRARLPPVPLLVQPNTFGGAM